MRWAEHDLGQLQDRCFSAALLRPAKHQANLPASLIFGCGVRSGHGGEFHVGNVLMFMATPVPSACVVCSGFQMKKLQLGLVVQKLTLLDAASPPSFAWTRWRIQDEFYPLPLNEARKSVRTTVHTCAGQEITLLR